MHQALLSPWALVCLSVVCLGVEAVHHRCAHSRIQRLVADAVQSTEVRYSDGPRRANPLGTATTSTATSPPTSPLPLSISIYLDPHGSRCLSTSGESTPCMCLHSGQPIATESGTLRRCANAEVLTSQLLSLLKRALATASGYISRALSAVSGPGLLQLTQVCHRIQTPSCMRKGLPADFVLMASVLPSDSNTTDLGAWAVSCQTDQFGRPIAGMVNVIPSALQRYGADLEAVGPGPESVRIYHNLVMLLVHEMVHALGFTPYFWANPDSGGYPMRGWFGGKKVLTTSGGIAYITSPEVVRLSKEHYGCRGTSQPIGLPVEQDGPTGSRGSHWEKDMLGNEAMTASLLSNEVRAVSPMTLAYFADSGHYRANYSSVSGSPAFSWGRGECLRPMECAGDMQCTPNLSPMRCSKDRASIVSCMEPAAGFARCASYTPVKFCVEEVRSSAALCVEDATGHPQCVDVSGCGGQQKKKGGCALRLQGMPASQAAWCAAAGSTVALAGVEVSCPDPTALCDAVRSADRWDGLGASLNSIPADFSQVSVPAEALSNACTVKAQVTAKGCACLQVWSAAGHSDTPCNDYCCKFGTEQRTWCFVEDPTCEGSNSGYCEVDSWERDGKVHAAKTAMLVVGVVLVFLGGLMYYRRKEREKAAEAPPHAPPSAAEETPEDEAHPRLVVGVPVAGAGAGPGPSRCCLGLGGCGSSSEAQAPPPLLPSGPMPLFPMVVVPCGVGGPPVPLGVVAAGGGALGADGGSGVPAEADLEAQQRCHHVPEAGGVQHPLHGQV